jgi:hypothetical protein
MKCCYRTTSTSPLIPLSVTIHSSNSVCNSTERAYDDIESDDDLDREDIAFPLDPGKFDRKIIFINNALIHSHFFN